MGMTTAQETSMPPGLPVMLNECQAAVFLGVSPSTLTTWRSLGRYNLKFYKVGGRVRYDTKHLLAFLQAREVTPSRTRRRATPRLSTGPRKGGTR